jgi:hypothetical protein
MSSPILVSKKKRLELPSDLDLGHGCLSALSSGDVSSRGLNRYLLKTVVWTAHVLDAPSLSPRIVVPFPSLSDVSLPELTSPCVAASPLPRLWPTGLLRCHGHSSVVVIAGTDALQRIPWSGVVRSLCRETVSFAS